MYNGSSPSYCYTICVCIKYSSISIELFRGMVYMHAQGMVHNTFDYKFTFVSIQSPIVTQSGIRVLVAGFVKAQLEFSFTFTSFPVTF